MGDGKTLNTAAIQKAIDACSAAGGGTVVVPAGRFLTGPLKLASNLNLHLDEGATLLISDNTADFEHKKRALRTASSPTNVTILPSPARERSTARAKFWWKRYVKSKTAPAADDPHANASALHDRAQSMQAGARGGRDADEFPQLPSRAAVVPGRGDRRRAFPAPAKAPNTDASTPRAGTT